jgi:hypothetical protein
MIEEPWLSMEPVRIGRIPPGLGTPDMYVTVMDDNEPVIRIDVYGYHGEESYTFSDFVVWGGMVLVGYGHRLYMVRLDDISTLTFDLQGYFGSLHIEGDRLIVASESNLFRFEPDGTLLWKSDEVGLDGVVVEDIGTKTITGRGQWDPPGGWRPFTVNAENGKLLEDT